MREGKTLIPEDFLEAIATERGVSDTELDVLSLALKGEPTTVIAKKQNTRPEVIRNQLGQVYKKFHILGAGPGKLAKLQQLLISEYQAHSSLSGSPTSAAQVAPNSENTASCRDFSDAPDISVFYGRTEELDKLKKWIVKDQCRLVMLYGRGGIGKTLLCRNLAEQIQDEFEYVIWRSLSKSPPFKKFLENLLQFLPQSLSTNKDDEVSQLIASLHKHRCLLILDGMDVILQQRHPNGHYREEDQKEFQRYEELIIEIAKQKHQSCLVITSREKPEQVLPLVGENLPGRALEPSGLKPSEAQPIFEAKGLSDEDSWQKLTEVYNGNPLELQIASSTIKELFNGKVSEFLKRNTLVFGGIRALLAEQFERLSDVEQGILYRLAIEDQPTSLEYLRPELSSLASEISFLSSESELFEAVAALIRRTLIENKEEEGKTYFTLSPVLMQYVTERVIKQIQKEIFALLKNHEESQFKLLKESEFKLLTSHLLIKNEELDSEKNIIPDSKLFTPVIKKLIKLLGNKNKIVEKLNKIIGYLEYNSTVEVGYSAQNLQRLIELMQK